MLAWDQQEGHTMWLGPQASGQQPLASTYLRSLTGLFVRPTAIGPLSAMSRSSYWSRIRNSDVRQNQPWSGYTISSFNWFVTPLRSIR